MHQMGANTKPIYALIKAIYAGKSIEQAIDQSNIPENIQIFLKYTFDIAQHAPAHVKAAVFTFGREDLIPDMFIKFLEEMESDHSDKVSTFKYYIERHIEVDGDHHSQLACQMTENLCGDSSQKWMEAEEEVIRSLQARVQLWDGALREIQSVKGLKEIEI